MITQSIRVAALYVDARGPYPKMPGVDCWDVARDATKYDGPGPIVAHPPCGPWGKLRHLYLGNEHDCAPLAVDQVRLWGGVLEHPAQSLLWAHAGLPVPGAEPDAFGGYTIQVDQCEWGHVARKGTWLYLAGVPRGAITPPPYPGRKPTHWCSGTRKRQPGSKGGVLPAGMKFCSAQQRRRTPLAFAEWLVSLAATAEVRA
jgi:hypothetical protein